tara:strand:- start:1761 stop:3275 length:1515 start_codon:yes stop_codon:yes gene_type:complete
MATDYKLRISAKDNTKKGFSGVDKNISKTQGAMKKLAGAFAGVFAVRAIVQFGAETLEVADNIGKTADAIGVTTGFLQKYQFAAQQSGVETEQFNKALKFFSKGVGEATMGTGLAKQAFEEMGISLKDSSGETKKSEALFKEFFVSLDSIQEPFKRNALLAQVFGAKVGITMANLVKGGSDAMNDLAESATGVITEESIRKAEAFNDTMNRLKRQVLLPLQEAFISTSTAILNFAETMGLISPDLFTKDLGQLNDMLIEQQGIYKENTRLLGEFGKIAATQYKPRADNAAAEIILLEEAIAKREKQIEIQKKLNAQLTNPAPLAEFKKNIKENITVVQQFANTVEGQLTSAFKNFFDFANTEFLNFKELATSIAQAVINELINVFIVKKLVGMATTAIGDIGSVFNGDFGNAVDAMSDFEGGGYTGGGVRAGGMDGKGGFMAMVHPNETVIDHTKGQRTGGATVNFNINAVDAAGFDQLLQSRKGLITSIINNAMNNQGKMGVV